MFNTLIKHFWKSWNNKSQEKTGVINKKRPAYWVIYANNWKAQSKNDPLIFRLFLKVFRSSWILACGHFQKWPKNQGIVLALSPPIIAIWNISQNYFFLTGSIEVEVTDTSKVYINIMVSFQQKSRLKSSQRAALQRNTIQHHPSYSPRWMPPLLNKLLFTTTKMIWNMKFP